MLALLLSSFVFGAASAALLSTPVSVGAGEENTHATVLNSSIPSGEEEIASDRVKFSATSSTITADSHSFGVTVSSEIVAFKNGVKYNNVYLEVTDPDFISEEESKAGPDATELPEFDCTVYAIFGTKSSFPDVIIPEYLTVGSEFKLHVISISANCCGSNAGSLWDKYRNIASIMIPDSVNVIEPNAFASCPSTVTIKCVSTAAKPGWASNWTDATNIVYGYTPSEAEAALASVKSGGRYSFGTGENFIIGSYEDGEYHQPLLAVYNTVDAQGNVVSRDNIYEIPLSSKNNPFDAVGSSIGSTSLAFDFDLLLPAGQSVDVNSLTFHNIREAGQHTDSAGNTVNGPDLTGKIYYAKPTLSFPAAYHLNQFISYKTTTVSVFNDYTSVGLNVDRVDGTYKLLNLDTYTHYLSQIEAGTYSVRYQFSSLGLCTYRIIYQSGSETKTVLVPLSTPIDFLLLSNESGNAFGFLLQNAVVGSDFSSDKIVSIDLIGFHLKLDLYNTSKHAILTNSAVTTRFGYINLYTKTGTGYRYTDVAKVILIVALVYLGLALLATFGYYFYAKTKYKNDEFRRVNDRRFFVSAAKDVFGFGLVTLAITFIVARWGMMNTTVVSYNPLDVFVIVFTIFGAIFLGFFIKDVVVGVKNAMKRRQAIRLKLDNDVADDGTK